MIIRGGRLSVARNGLCQCDVLTKRSVIGRLLHGIGAILAVFCLFGVQAPVALSASPSAPVPGFSLTVSPTRVVIPTNAISVTRKFLVANRGRSPFKVTVDKADFIASESGALTFVRTAPYAAANWAQVTPTQFWLAAGTSRNVTFRVGLPPRAEPGDHQFALIFKVPAGRNSANIRINRGVAAPVFIDVAGAVNNSAEVVGLRAPGFVTHGPVSLTAKVRDLGTVHRDFRAKGRLYVDAAGDRVGFPDFTVLRDSTREVAARWNPPLMCVCHATLRVANANGTESTATVRIVVLPLHLMALLTGATVALLLFRWFLRRRFRARVLAAAESLQADRDATGDDRGV